MCTTVPLSLVWTRHPNHVSLVHRNTICNICCKILVKPSGTLCKLAALWWLTARILTAYPCDCKQWIWRGRSTLIVQAIDQGTKTRGSFCHLPTLLGRFLAKEANVTRKSHVWLFSWLPLWFRRCPSHLGWTAIKKWILQMFYGIQTLNTDPILSGGCWFAWCWVFFAHTRLHDDLGGLEGEKFGELIKFPFFRATELHVYALLSSNDEFYWKNYLFTRAQHERRTFRQNRNVNWQVTGERGTGEMSLRHVTQNVRFRQTISFQTARIYVMTLRFCGRVIKIVFTAKTK